MRPGLVQPLLFASPGVPHSAPALPVANRWQQQANDVAFFERSLAERKRKQGGSPSSSASPPPRPPSSESPPASQSAAAGCSSDPPDAPAASTLEQPKPQEAEHYCHSVTGQLVLKPAAGCETSKSGKSRVWTLTERTMIHEARRAWTGATANIYAELARALRARHPTDFASGTPCKPGGILPPDVRGVLRTPLVADAERKWGGAHRPQALPDWLVEKV